MSRPIILIVFFLASYAQADGVDRAGGGVDFDRQVRPILAKHCITCHGPDESAREAGLRLDIAEGATEDRGGYQAVVPGNSEASELMVRITNSDADVRMPPSESHEALSKAEIEILRRWIDEGAGYTRHWAFREPTMPPIPQLSEHPGFDLRWRQSPIDTFVLDAMIDAKLEPSEAADRYALVRRLYLDLCGVTPSPAQVEAFIGDDSPQAYARLVDRLLASPDYAERFARDWLDLARYADTHGYEKDRPRMIWPYRDWVIDAINRDMPYDQFSVAQLAGDMLPPVVGDPDQTLANRIATGFHRNTMLNEEGGIDPLEYRFYALVDRVATTGTVWMGLTIGCAQCHTHKYDPITHRDYYGMMALLNQADEPELVIPDDRADQQRRRIRQNIERQVRRLARSWLPSQAEVATSEASDIDNEVGKGDRDRIAEAFVGYLRETVSRVRPWTTIVPMAIESTLPKLSVLKDGSVLASGDVTKRDVYRLKFDLDEFGAPVTALRLDVLPHASLPAGGPGLAFYEGRRGDFFLSEMTVTAGEAKVPLKNLSHSYGNISVGSGDANASNVADGEGSTGWSTSDAEGESNHLIANFAVPLDPSILENHPFEVELVFERHFAAALGHFRFSVSTDPDVAVATDLPIAIEKRLQSTRSEQPIDDASEIPADLFEQIQQHFVRTANAFQSHRASIQQLKKELPETVRTLVMRERPTSDRRQTHRHHRGEYLQDKEAVDPAIPSYFGSLPEDQSADRLTLAQWLVSDGNPLVARVVVNRAWRAFFGSGIVRTAGDFGTQSRPPTHPELLDYLGQDLRRSGWSIKRLHRKIVMSQSYQQAVGEPPQSDPENLYLSVFPNRRLSAEQVRDVMLSAAGAMTRVIGGPSVYPPQPVGVYEMAYGSPEWNVSEGGDRYRRSLYTFAKRTAPFAALTTFDGPTGELCLARRDQSTTPLQALTLMNDPMYVEIAALLADDVKRSLRSNATPTETATAIFKRLLVRDPSSEELTAMLQFVGQQHDRPWMLLARAIINTDEAIVVP